MTQLNPKLRQLFSGTDFKDTSPFLFGENFRVLAKKCPEASEALSPLTKELDRVFRRAIPRKTQVTEVATSQVVARQEQGTRGSRPLAKKPGKGQRID